MKRHTGAWLFKLTCRGRRRRESSAAIILSAPPRSAGATGSGNPGLVPIGKEVDAKHTGLELIASQFLF